MGDSRDWDILGPVTIDPDGMKAMRRAEDYGAAKASRQIHIERIAADAEATRYLAEMECPEDLIEWGKNHNIPTFAEVTWMAGFMRGWRMAVARSEKMAKGLGEES